MAALDTALDFFDAAQYKVLCNNCTKLNKSLVGGEKSIVLENNTSSISDEKSNEYSVFILIEHYILQTAKLIKRKPSRP